MVPSFFSMNHQGVLLIFPGWGAISLQGYQGYHQRYAISRVVKSSRLQAKIATYLVSIGWLLCLAFLSGWCFLFKISLDWLLTLTTQASTTKLSVTTLHQYPFRHMGEERERQAKFFVSENAMPVLGLNLDLTGLMLKVQLHGRQPSTSSTGLQKFHSGKEMYIYSFCNSAMMFTIWIRLFFFSYKQWI